MKSDAGQKSIFNKNTSKIGLMPRPSARTKLLSRRFCPRQIEIVWDKNFVQGQKDKFFPVKILSK